MIRKFSNITRGVILQELKSEGLEKITPLQFLRIEKKAIDKGTLTPATRNGGNWRIYTPEQKALVKKIMWEYYGGKSYSGA